MSYPPKLLRGIPDESHIVEGQVVTSLFQFNNPKKPRKDNFNECSINWKDNNGALKKLLQEKGKSGKLKYTCGAAVLSRAEIDRLIKRSFAIKNLSYERKIEEEMDNIYHGNLLLDKNINEPIRRLITAKIAMDCVKEIIPPTAIIKKNTLKSFIKNLSLIKLIKKYL